MIVAVLVSVGIVAVVAYTQLSKSSNETAEVSTSQETPAESTSSASRGSIKSLLTAGKNVTCEINFVEGSGGGTVFVAGNKVRGDFSVALPEHQTTESHMIQDGEFIYLWSGTQGTKMKADQIENASPAPSTQTQASDIDKEVDLNCSSWTVDDSKFTPPSDVTFLEVAIPPTQGVQGSNTKDVQMTYCEQLTDPQAKAACISALGGN